MRIIRIRNTGLADRVISENRLPCGVSNNDCGCQARDDKNINLVVNVNSNNSSDTNNQRPVVSNPAIVNPVVVAEENRDIRNSRYVLPQDKINEIRGTRIIASPDKVNKVRCAETFYPEFI